MADLTGRIESIIEGDVNFSSIISSYLIAKIGESINGLNLAFNNIGFEAFSSSGIWSSPTKELCWVIAIGVGAGGGGGGGGLSYTPPASNGLAGGDATLDSVTIAAGGAGGAAVSPAIYTDTRPICSKHRSTIQGISGGKGGNGGRKPTVNPDNAYSSLGAGTGGHDGSFGMKIFQNLNPSTNYVVNVGVGGAPGANTATNSTDFISGTSGEPGSVLIIYSGY